MLQQMRSRSLLIWAFVFVFFVVGFLLADSSGLMGIGVGSITPGTAVAKVNGVEVNYIQWQNLSNQLAQQQERQGSRSLTLDERQRIEDQAFEQMVSNILLAQEYEKRGIRVSNEDIIQAAQQNPPAELLQDPSLQTDGIFDIAKYRRLLGSPAARQQGLLAQLENYYRAELPRARLFDQLASDVFVSDPKLWSTYRDLRDSAKVSFVMFDAAAVPDSAVKFTDAELRSYYDKNKASLERPGRASLSVLTIPRTLTAEDSAASRARAVTIREEILGGAKFEDVARLQSGDTVSGAQGGDLGRAPSATYVKEFADAAKSMRTGAISEPVLSPFGYHIIRKDAQVGDTLALHHILVRIQQSDSSASRTDRKADSLSRIAASTSEGERLDSAAKVLKLVPERIAVIEGEPAFSPTGRVIPSVSAFAFTGAKVGEISDLYDADDLYALARVDSLIPGGVPSFDAAKEDIRRFLSGRKKAETRVDEATAFANAAAASTLEATASSRNMTVTTTDLFSRPQFVPGLGRFNEAIGAAFSLPVGAVSAPIVTDQGVVVLRVDQRKEADRAEWEAQKEQQRREAIQAIQQLRVRTFLNEIRKDANVVDNRKKLQAAARAQAAI